MVAKLKRKLPIKAGFKLMILAALALVTIFTALIISSKNFTSPTAPSSQPEAKCYPAECDKSSDCGAGYTCKAKCCISNNDPKPNGCKTDKDCSNGKKCKAGVCKSPAATPTPKTTPTPIPTKICNPGAKKCLNGNVVICEQYGYYWMGWDDCSGMGCASGKCLVCKPGTRECYGDIESQIIKICNSSGTGWYEGQECSIPRSYCKDGFCHPFN